MHHEEIEKIIIPCLDKPKTRYELAFETGYSTACIHEFLKILEVADKVLMIRQGKKNLWVKKE